MTKREVIDGAGIAAQIVSRLPLEEQRSLFASIRQADPKVAAILGQKMIDFSRVAQLKDNTLQNFLHDIPHRDIAISLKTAESSVKQRILENVSENKLQMVKEDYESLPPMKVPDVEAAQRRILKRLEELYPDESQAPVKKTLTSRLV